MKNLLFILLLLIVNPTYAKDDLFKIKDYKNLIEFINNENVNNTEMQKVIYINDVVNGMILPNNKVIHQDYNNIITT